MKKPSAEFIRRIFMSLIGTSLLGVCVALLRKANLGTDPFTCLCVGLSNTLHISYGIAYLLVIATLLVAVFLLNKKYIGIATILNLFLVGPIGDASFKILNNIYQVNSILDMILTFLAAILILCFASSLYITADLGVSSYDAMSLIMTDHLKDKKIGRFTWGQYRYFRIFTDCLCVLFGFIQDAVIGIGTVITALCLGPLTQWCNTHISEPLRYGKNYTNPKKKLPTN